MANVNMLKIKKRAISDEFLKKFIDENGCFKPLLNLIDKNGIYKSRFMLNLRGTTVQIYYKCKHVLTIFEKHSDSDEDHKDKIKFECTARYIHNINKKGELIWDKTFIDLIKLGVPKIIEKGKNYRFFLSNDEIKDFDWKSLLNALCDGIDFCNTYKDEAEKEAQQRIWFENNIARGSNSTEYVIVDTEYEVSHGGRFDLWGFRWPNHSAKKPEMLVCMELKFGQAAVNDKNSGDNQQQKKKQSSLKGHLKDFREFKEFLDKGTDNRVDFYEDISKVFCQLYRMNMIDMTLEAKLKKAIYNNQYPMLITKDTNKQMMFILANYKPKATVLENQILALIAEQTEDQNNKKIVKEYISLSNKKNKSQKDTEKIEELTTYIIKMVEEYIKTAGNNHSNDEVIFAGSSYCGYGLYKDNTVSLTKIVKDLDIIKKVKEQVKDFKNKKV